MNSLASSLAYATNIPDHLSQAEKWADKAIELIKSVQSVEPDAETVHVCDLILVAALFNKGSIKEVCVLHVFVHLCVLTLFRRWRVNKTTRANCTSRVGRWPPLSRCVKEKWRLIRRYDA